MLLLEPVVLLTSDLLYATIIAIITQFSVYTAHFFQWTKTHEVTSQPRNLLVGIDPRGGKNPHKELQAQSIKAREWK